MKLSKLSVENYPKFVVGGFTIIEILLSIIILVMLLTVVHTSFRAGSKACRFGTQRAQIFHTARLAMQDIIESIENDPR